MKKLVSVVLLVLTIFTFASGRPALAANLANGAKVFSANCVACHMGGGNAVMAAKTLKQEALEKYGMNSVEAITYQVKNGKNAMPAFKGRLQPAQIDDVAAYVLAQAEKGWK